MITPGHFATQNGNRRNPKPAGTAHCRFSQAGGNVVIIGVPGLAPTLDTNGRGTVRVRVSLQKLFMSTGPIPLTNIDAATM